ncbi:unnamed protein product [Psylliodes chrysocephalus]|uniref:Gustatory receptor n=1 Tax=Psylliodes chrysocephalus TaxID=3402493 RepID=A0A9P0CHJ0_9CUCU|nr:unnamed protein product [Psylliodes chrysocephala]
MLIFFYIWLALEISNRFQILNNLFENQFSLKMQSPIYSTHTHSAYKKMNLLKEISHIRIFHDHLCEMVVAMNDIFGFVILFAVLFSLAFTLEYLIILILYVIMKHLLNGKEILVEVKYASIMWILENCIRVVTLAYTGERLSRQANRMIDICCKMMKKIDLIIGEDAKRIKSELKFTLVQISHRQPTLSAAGFFNVNFQMIGFLISSLTSYILVAVQFFQSQYALSSQRT